MRARKTTISSNSLLVVHGRGFKPPAESLHDVIAAALRAGVARDYPEYVDAYDSAAVSLAYYGDLSSDLLSGHGQQYDEQLDMGDRSSALQSLRNIDVRKRFGIRQYDCLPGKTAVPEFVANFIAPICGALGMTIPLLARISRDFAEYLCGETAYAEQVRQRLRNQLCEMFDRGDRVMLITHGTGCVVAYDVLWQLSHEQPYAEQYSEAKVDTWVTLGAPLGDTSIRKRLLGSTGEPVSYPTNVITWNNVSAEDDYTCHDNTLADDFKSMVQQRVVSAVNDYHVYNLAVRYGKSNPHSSIGYYIHPRVSKIIADWLRQPVLDAEPNYTI